MLADPARSNRLIAVSAGIRPEMVAAVRRALEAAGRIPRIPVADRAWRAYPPPPVHHRARDAIEQGAATSREVADLAGVSMSMAWRALRKYRPGPPAPAIVLGLIEQPPLEMQLGGLCFQRGAPLIWASDDPADQARAVATCRVCSVREMFCHGWALRNVPVTDLAVYAGLTGVQRNRLRRERNR